MSSHSYERAMILKSTSVTVAAYLSQLLILPLSDTGCSILTFMASFDR